MPAAESLPPPAAPPRRPLLHAPARRPTRPPARAPRDPGLASSRQKMPDLLGAAYWRRLAAAAGADLHVEDAKAQAKALTPRATLPRARCDDLRRQICGAGVAQVRRPAESRGAS